jgi:asparagine synthase (glutamine-hydrolysing)
VRLRLISDVPLGVFLSGGVDSSGVAYWMSKHQSHPVQSFSIGFGEDSYNELPYAREVAASVGAEHRERVLDADAAAMLPAIVRHAEEPTADSSMIAVYHLAALARPHVTVALSGDGADDILAGYETHQAYYLHRAYAAIPRMLRRRIIAPVIRSLPPSNAKVSASEKLKRFIAAADRCADDAHASWRIVFDDETRRRILSPLLASSTCDPLQAYRDAFARTNARHPLNRMLYVDTRLYLPADMLVKIDRMTMAHGLEAREPYLDYRLVEFAARVPPRLKLKHFTSKKYLLKAALHGRVPSIAGSRDSTCRKAPGSAPDCGRSSPIRCRRRDYALRDCSIRRRWPVFSSRTSARVKIAATRSGRCSSSPRGSSNSESNGEGRSRRGARLRAM